MGPSGGDPQLPRNTSPVRVCDPSKFNAKALPTHTIVCPGIGVTDLLTEEHTQAPWKVKTCLSNKRPPFRDGNVLLCGSRRELVHRLGALATGEVEAGRIKLKDIGGCRVG